MQIRLAPYETRHVPLLFEAARESVREIHPWMTWCHPAYAMAESEDWVRAQIENFSARTAFNFVIESEQGNFLGACGVDKFEVENQRCNLGYWVRTSATKCGVATSAARALASWAFQSTEMVRLEILVAVGNIASRRVALKAGAQEEGTLRSRLLLHGRYHDSMLYSIIRGSSLTGRGHG